MSEGHAHDGVSSAIIYGHLVAIAQGGTGEYDIGHIACQFVGCGGCQEVVERAVEHLLGIVEVKQGCSHRIAIAIAGADDAVVEQQPTFFGLDGHTAGSNLEALPCALLEGRHLHHAAVLAPVFHVGTITDVNVAEGCVAVVAGAREHGIAAANLLGEEHAVAVEGQEGVLALIEGIEVESVADTDGRAMVTVAPGNPIAVFYPRDARVVFVVGLYHLGIASLPLNGLVVDVPMNAVLAETSEDVHLHLLVVAAEYASISILEGNDCAVEDAVAARDVVATDNGVLAIAPHDVVAVGRAVLPREGNHSIWDFCIRIWDYRLTLGFSRFSRDSRDSREPREPRHSISCAAWIRVARSRPCGIRARYNSRRPRGRNAL